MALPCSLGEICTYTCMHGPVTNRIRAIKTSNLHHLGNKVSNLSEIECKEHNYFKTTTKIKLSNSFKSIGTRFNLRCPLPG